MEVEKSDFGVFTVRPFGDDSLAEISKYRNKIRINLSLQNWYTEDKLEELLNQIKNGLAELKKHN
jgi:hypothetical protein